MHASGEMPFRVHLYSEEQIKHYIRYLKKEKYSFVHIDATGGVLKPLRKQNDLYLYAAIFKDGTDCINTVPLAHGILTDHSVPSIGFFFANLQRSITQINNRNSIFPSFFVIDFSAALMNAILQAFNIESINAHLNRCWNVLCRKYSTIQLRSSSFIHLCCCHVIHAVARSLNVARIDKKIRRGVLSIFAFILCGNDMEQLYNTLGTVIKIFGDPNEQKAKEIFEKMSSLQLDADEETVLMLKDDEKIFKEAEEDEEDLKLVDEYLHSNTPIIHQSPFNREAIRRYPILTTLLNNKSKYGKVVNPLFSPSIIRMFYRWWAYLPLWTGLLWNFEERYSKNIQTNAAIEYHPIRYSNAIIESYFRTLKHSVLGKKTANRPMDLIRQIHRSVKVQIKACKFGITQSSKGRKRGIKNVPDVSMTTEEEWHKNGVGRKNRHAYTGLIDKYVAKRTQPKINDARRDAIIDKTTYVFLNFEFSKFFFLFSAPRDNEKISSKSQSPLSQDKSNNKILTKYNKNYHLF